MKWRPAFVARVIVAVLLTTSLSSAEAAEGVRSAAAPGPPALPVIIEGMSFAGWWNDAFEGPGPLQSLDNLKATGVEAVSIVPTAYQWNVHSTDIYWDGPRTTTDASVEALISYAHSIGLQVMLKPHVDLDHPRGYWRGDIGRDFTRAERRAWFRSYRALMVHYADIAEAAGVEAFSVGCELEGVSGRGRQWRRVVESVRAHYSGTLTYAATTPEAPRIGWWDAVDFIGVDAYYPLTDINDPTVQQLVEGWAPHLDELAALSARWGKTIVFTEIGYRSIDGANKYPGWWQVGGGIDLQEQADCYAAAFEATRGQAWFGGMFWWMWDPEPNAGGPDNDDYTAHFKPAEQVLSAHYGGTV